jgi:hypothetical protein
VACSSMLPSARPPASALWINSFRGAMARLRVPLPTSRLPPHEDLRTARGQSGSLDLPWNGLTPYTPYRSPGKSGRCVSASDRQQSGRTLNGRPLAGGLCEPHHGQAPRQRGAGEL